MKCRWLLGPFVVFVLLAVELNAKTVPSPGNAVEAVYEATKRAWNKPCLVNDNCYKSFFELENYCCAMVCCNYIEFIVRDKNYLQNIVVVIEQPRPINVIVTILGVLLTAFLAYYILGILFVCLRFIFELCAFCTHTVFTANKYNFVL